MSRFLSVSAASLLAALTQAVYAADLPLKAPAMVAAPYNWTGFYVGANIGGGWGTSDTTLAAIPTIGVAAGLPLSSISPSGVIGGGQVGANWQTGRLVLGVQADVDGADLTGNVPCSIAGRTFSCGNKSDWLATVSGRVGGLVDPRLLVYVKGGGAWQHSTYSLSDPAGVVFAAGSTFSSTDTRSGWLVGVGGEYAFADRWTAFVEYNHMDFGTANESSFLPAPVAAVVTGSVRDKLNVVKAGANLRF
jgi:outer membrane immunogenic protein